MPRHDTGVRFREEGPIGWPAPVDEPCLDERQTTLIVVSPRSLGGSLTLVAAVFLAGCGDGSRNATRLTGAGASFPNPIYTRWFDEYHRATGVQINYQSIGSGGGIRQFTQGTIDFGATDGPMTDDQIASIDGDVLHISRSKCAQPVCVNA